MLATVWSYLNVLNILDVITKAVNIWPNTETHKMSYLPQGMPVPEPSSEDAPFWNACLEGKLLIRHCQDCQKHFHPPMPGCTHCGSTNVDWREVSGNGSIFTYTVIHHPAHSVLKGHPPYNVSVVLLDDADDVRVISNVIDVPPSELSVGMPVSVCFEDAGNGMMLPRFKRRAEKQNGGSNDLSS